MAGGDTMIPMDGWTTPGLGDFHFEPLFPSIAWLSWLNKPMLQLFLAAVVVVVIWVVAAHRLQVRPRKGQFFMEFVYDFIRNGIARDMIGADYKRWVPLLVGMFSLIVINNWFGEFFLLMFPTFSNIGYVYGMVILVYLIYIGAGIQAHGKGYLKHALVPPGLPIYMYPIVIPLEFISVFITRPLTLSIRLFANMFAGHLVVLVFVLGGSFLITYAGNAVYNVAGGLSFVMAMLILALELFIGFLQAYIFTILTASYISSAIAEEH